MRFQCILNASVMHLHLDPLRSDPPKMHEVTKCNWGLIGIKLRIFPNRKLFLYEKLI